jgi:hypothetical protein
MTKVFTTELTTCARLDRDVVKFSIYLLIIMFIFTVKRKLRRNSGIYFIVVIYRKLQGSVLNQFVVGKYNL